MENIFEDILECRSPYFYLVMFVLITIGLRLEIVVFFYGRKKTFYLQLICISFNIKV